MEAGAPGGIRTPNPRIRSPMLCPVELRARATANYPLFLLERNHPRQPILPRTLPVSTWRLCGVSGEWSRRASVAASPCDDFRFGINGIDLEPDADSEGASNDVCRDRPDRRQFQRGAVAWPLAIALVSIVGVAVQAGVCICHHRDRPLLFARSGRANGNSPFLAEISVENSIVDLDAQIQPFVIASIHFVWSTRRR